jgi:hypothetical protein
MRSLQRFRRIFGMRGFISHRLPQLAIAALSLVLVIAVPSGAQATSLHWSGRSVLDSAPPFANPHSVHDVSCPSTTLCVGVDGSGSVVTTADATGGGPSGCGSCTWTSDEIDPGTSISGVSCPTTSLCVAVDSSGDVLVSTQPTGGASAWKRTNVDGQAFLTRVSCATASMCVAVDDSGNIVSSTNPTGGSSDWSVAQVGDSSGFTSVSCPTSSLCVAGDFGGNVVTSTDPTGGASAWAAPVSISLAGLTSMTCASASVCVSGDEGGNVLTSADPTGGSSQWSSASVDSGSFFLSISCPTTSSCVAVDDDGNDVSSRNPLGGAAAWSAPANIAGGNDVTIWGVSCPTETLCAAVTDAGDDAWSTNPLATLTNTPVWHGPYNIAGQHTIGGMSCPSLGLCVAASDSGNAVTSVGTSSAPAALSSSWAAPKGGTGVNGQLRAMSCSPSGRLCVGVGGVVIGSSDASNGPAAHWFNFGHLTGWGELQGVSCPTDRYCQAVDDGGQVMSLVDQSATGSQFPLVTDGPAVQVDGSNVIHAVSCPSLNLCVAVDDAGNALISTNPAQGAWGTKPVEPGESLRGVSCPSMDLCIAVNADGGVVTLHNPGANMTVSVGAFDGGHSLNAISCTTSLCVGVDDAGQALISTNAGAALPAWSLATIDPGHALVSISCAATGLCVAGDDDGGAVAGSVAAPVATTSASRFTSATTGDLSGTVNPNAATLSDCHFEFGTTTAYGRSVPCAAFPSGTTTATVTAHVTGLAPNTPFHVQLVAGNAGGVGKGVDRPATTPPLPPTVGALAATNVSSTTAALTGSVDPNGGALTGCHFLYGPTKAYGRTAPCRQTVSGGVRAAQVSATATGLKLATTYHFTLVADNLGGEAKGADTTFRMPATPTVHIAAGGAVRHGATSFRLRCAGAKGATCVGRMVLTLRSHNRAIRIGSVRYHLVAPGTARTNVRLTAFALRRLSAAAGHRLRVVASLIPTSGAATHVTVQLHR